MLPAEGEGVLRADVAGEATVSRQLHAVRTLGEEAVGREMQEKARHAGVDAHIGVGSGERGGGDVAIVQLLLIVRPEALDLIGKEVHVARGHGVDVLRNILGGEREILVALGAQVLVAVDHEHAEVIPIHVKLLEGGRTIASGIIEAEREGEKAPDRRHFRRNVGAIGVVIIQAQTRHERELRRDGPVVLCKDRIGALAARLVAAGDELIRVEAFVEQLRAHVDRLAVPAVEGEHKARLRHAIAVDQVALIELLEGGKAVVGVGIDRGLEGCAGAEAIVGGERTGEIRVVLIGVVGREVVLVHRVPSAFGADRKAVGGRITQHLGHLMRGVTRDLRGRFHAALTDGDVVLREVLHHAVTVKEAVGIGALVRVGGLRRPVLPAPTDAHVGVEVGSVHAALEITLGVVRVHLRVVAFIERRRLDGGRDGERPFGALGDNVDHAAHGLRSVEGRRGALHDLDPLHIVRVQAVIVHIVTRLARHAFAVDQKEDVLTAEAL